MKILPKHRKVFKQCLEEITSLEFPVFLCNLVSRVCAGDEQLRQECCDLIFFYFQDYDDRSALWYPEDTGFNPNTWTDTAFKACYHELTSMRIIALYTLIYAPT